METATENELLKSALDAEICRQIREASHFTPRHVVLARVVETVCGHLNLPLASLPDYRNSIRLDAETKRMMEEYWNGLSNGHSSELREELEKILAKDHHKPADVIRFVNACLRRESKRTRPAPESSKLHAIFAADGYSGEDVKRYVDHLKWDEVKSVHVRAVRRLYREGLVKTPAETHSVLRSVFDSSHPCSNSEAKTLYASLVGDSLEAVRDWKKSQEKESTRTVKKRKIETVNPESPKKRGRKSMEIRIPADPPAEENEDKIDTSDSSSDSESENSS